MRRLFLFIDDVLRRRQNIEEFWDHPDCVLRISRRSAPQALPVGNGVYVSAGAPALEIHLWNEHVIRPERADSSLAWAARSGSALVRSLAVLAQRIEQRPDYADVEAVFGVTTFMSEKEAKTAERLLARLGFAYAPYRSPLGVFGDFWENLHVRVLQWTFRRPVRHVPRLGRRRSSRGPQRSGATQRRRGPQRRVLWMSKEALLKRYASGGSPPERRKAGALAKGTSSPSTGMAWRSIS